MKMARISMIGVVALCAGLALPLISTAQQAGVDTSDVRAEDTPVGNLIRVPIERTQINDFIYQASGLGNAYLVNTSDGAIIIDTGEVCGGMEVSLVEPAVQALPGGVTVVAVTVVRV